MDASEGSKVCNVCGDRKPLEEFYRADGCVDGRRGECRTCFQAKARARKAANPDIAEEARRRTQRWRADNPERYAENQRRFKESGGYARSLRKWHLKTKYGLTPEDDDNLLDEQGGGCAICGDPPPATGSLHVDHDHDTGRVRSLLCFQCNAGLGQFRHDPDLLWRAAEYAGTHRRVGELAAVAVTEEQRDAGDAAILERAIRRRLDALAGRTGRGR